MKYIAEEIQWEEAARTRALAGSENPIFLDIETMGLSPRQHPVYLIGAALLSGDVLRFRQWLTEGPEEEYPMLREAAAFCREGSGLVHFNGSAFDLPFLDRRLALGNPSPAPEESFSLLPSLDLYRRLSPCRDILHLPDSRQKTWEAFLGIAREDEYSGGDLIRVCREWQKQPEPEGERLLLLHNREDVLALPRLLVLLAYPDFLSGGFSVTEIPAAEWEPEIPKLTLTLRLDRPVPCPAAFSFTAEDTWDFFLRGDLLRLTVPACHGELRYFFPDYRNYYYLPAEDMAIHKSVASYVDRAYRKKATEKTAYLRREGSFIRVPQNTEGHKIFSREAGSPPWILTEENLLSDPLFWNRYLKDLLHQASFIRSSTSSDRKERSM